MIAPGRAFGFVAGRFDPHAPLAVELVGTLLKLLELGVAAREVGQPI
ncbi:MAG TPA: hypothetical protein VL691_06880 [Vicinamibacteria bacterium]|nr:hypothetical protein [Vicinamibacteria bacterium]